MFLENSVHVNSCAKMPQKFDRKKRLSSSVPTETVEQTIAKNSSAKS